MNPAFAQRYGDFSLWHWWFRGRERILAAVLARELGGRRVRRLASLGCGPPCGLAWVRRFVDADGMVVGVDAEAWDADGRASGARLVVASADAAPLRARSCDVVLALDVLEHLDDDVAGVREAMRLLAPGGVLVVTVPALPSLWGAQDEVSHHRRRYTRRTLREAFARAGASPAYLGYFNTVLLPPVAAIRWLRRLVPARGPVHSDFDAGRPGPVNDVLAAVFASERHVVGRWRLPLGVSLIAVLRAA